MESKRTCPECNLIFTAEMPETGVLVCPLCNAVFSALPPAAPTTAPPPTAASGRQVLHGVLAVGAVFLLGGGLGYAYYLMGGMGRTAAEPATAASAPHAVEPIPPIPAEPKPPDTAPRPRPVFRRPQLQPLALDEDARRSLPLAERVNRAIDAGVAYLLAHHADHNQYRNYLGLLGLTLLECDVPADDPAVRQIAAWIRAREDAMMQTYELTTAILFLDRLGEPRDRALIRTFGQRLLSGQFDCGAWTYSCLLNEHQRRRADVSSDVPYTQIIQLRPKVVRYGVRPAREKRIVYHGDNSNTQFAILGLWVAQRYGVAARAALLANEQYFRATQWSDGSWTYHPNAHNSCDSMTCAGLMSLAMRYGVIAGQGRDIRPNHPIAVHDAAIHQGLHYLAQSFNKISVVGNRIIGVDARDPLYYLWSLERMAVIYDLKKIGAREWYPWAAQMLVDAQCLDGHWPGIAEPAATCFALLVLKRSNFAKDLQLAVQPPASRPTADLNGLTTSQRPDASLGQTGKAQDPTSMSGTAIRPDPSAPLGKGIARTPQTK